MSDTIVVNKNNCPRCGSQTVQSRMWDDMNFNIKPVNTKLFAPSSGVEAYVCSKCGHIELFASSMVPFLLKND